MRSHFIALVLCVGSLLSQPSFSQKQPNLSGTWKLNLKRSSWGDTKAKTPTSLEWRIRQSGNSFKVEIMADDISNALEFVADGKRRFAGTAGNIKVLVQAHWEDRNLVSSASFESGQLPDLTSRYSLSADGTILTVKRHSASIDQIFVFEKK